MLVRTLHEFYREKKYPTLDTLLVAVREKGIFTGECATLWKILHNMGSPSIRKAVHDRTSTSKNVL